MNGFPLVRASAYLWPVLRRSRTEQQFFRFPKAFQGLWTLASFSPFFWSLYHFQRFQAAHLLQPEPRAGPVAGFELLPISSQVFLLHIKFWHLSEVKTKRALWLMKPSCLLQGGAVKYSSDGRIIIGSSWWRAFRQRGVPFCLHLILAHLPSFSVFFWKVRVMMGCMSELWTLFFLFWWGRATIGKGSKAGAGLCFQSLYVHRC